MKILCYTKTSSSNNNSFCIILCQYSVRFYRSTRKLWMVKWWWWLKWFSMSLPQRHAFYCKYVTYSDAKVNICWTELYTFIYSDGNGYGNSKWTFKWTLNFAGGLCRAIFSAWKKKGVFLKLFFSGDNVGFGILNTQSSDNISSILFRVISKSIFIFGVVRNPWRHDSWSELIICECMKL